MNPPTQKPYSPPVVFHPGTLLEEKLRELQMGPKEFAIRTGKPEKTVTAILKGDSAITPDMAVLFEQVLYIPAHFWLNAQRSYDEFTARQKHQGEIKAAIDWAKTFPLNAMIKKGWLPAGTTWEEKTLALLRFFGVSTPKAWEAYYVEEKLKVAFRISLSYASEPEAVSAWLRQGELEALKTTAEPYDEGKFKAALPALKKLMAAAPADFLLKLKKQCAAAGVKLVFTPCLPKATCNGATRWLGNTPLIQLSDRYKRYDIFWFTFFHEAGHILLHGKKDIFVETQNFMQHHPEKEAEADAFAVKWTLSEAEEAQVIEEENLTLEALCRFAKKAGTHGAIIAGRLARKGLLPHSFGAAHFSVPVDLTKAL